MPIARYAISRVRFSKNIPALQVNYKLDEKRYE